jgi:hypothetical protein
VSRLPTALVVAAVALVGILATADALRGDEPEPPRPAGGTTPRERPSTLVETLREVLVIGRILYSDPDCRVHSLTLPELADQVLQDEGHEVIRCRFDSTEGWLLDEGERLSPDHRLVAECVSRRGRYVTVSDARTGVVRRRMSGCESTWRPPVGHRLTWAHGEAVYERGRPLLTRDDLERAARHHPNLAFLKDDIPMRVHVRALAWVDADHLAASLEIRAQRSAPEFLFVVFEGRKVIVAATNFRTSPRRLFATPTGSFVAGDDGTIVTAAGDVVDPPDQLPTGRAVAFSPDERWLAYVTGRSIYLLGTPRNNEPGRIIRLPIPARDLAWERVNQATQVGPPIRR